MDNPDQIADLLQTGIAAAKAGRKTEAHQALLRVTELDERNEQAWLWLSGVVDALEDRRVCIENVLAINPHNLHAQAGLRLLDQQTSPPSAAEEICPLCKSPVPPSGSTCPHCGQVLIVACPNCEQYVDVTEVLCPQCGQLLGDFREGARYHVGLARAYLERRLGARAQEAIARAEAEAHEDAQILQEVAALHEALGHTDMAIAVYRTAIERLSGNATLYARLGAIYHRRAMTDEARAMYEEAARRASDDPKILFELAKLYLEEHGTASSALGLLEKVVRLDAEHSEAHQLLGDLYLERGQGKKAVEHYERASVLSSPDTMAGREVRRKLTRWRPAMPREAQGWGETLRRVGGLMLSPVLAALINARLIPWEISLQAWSALAAATIGAYLWVCATDVPRNPVMCGVFGREGVKGGGRQALVGMPGVLLWCGAFGLILWKV